MFWLENIFSTAFFLFFFFASWGLWGQRGFYLKKREGVQEMGAKPLKALRGYRGSNRGSKGSRKNTRGSKRPGALFLIPLPLLRTCTELVTILRRLRPPFP